MSDGSLAFKIAERLRRDFFGWPLGAAALSVAAGGAALGPVGAAASALGAEAAVRAILKRAYGENFEAALFFYSLVDHEDYGYTLRPDVDLKNVPGLVFDSFLFHGKKVPLGSEAENRAARVEYHTNSRGFRGPEFSPAPKVNGKKTIRIFCSGGSTTAGDQVSDAEAFPARLQASLAARGIDAEVINAGVFGWFSYQELVRFRKEIVDYAPDVVLLHQGWNEEFEYSSLDYGKDWKPRVVRNAVECNSLYTAKSPLLSQKKSLALHLLVRSALRRYRFLPKMRFDNADRWDMLMAPAYQRAWAENVLEFARISHERGIMLFTLDYPCLATPLDTPQDRRTYYAKTRLTPNFADYQAYSKMRISHVLRSLDAIAPNIDLDAPFRKLRSAERVPHFLDEIHLSPKGNALFAEELAKALSANEDFRRRADPTVRAISNVKDFSPAEASAALDRSQKNPGFIDEFVWKKRALLRASDAGTAQMLQEVPTDRYTTF